MKDDNNLSKQNNKLENLALPTHWKRKMKTMTGLQNLATENMQL